VGRDGSPSPRITANQVTVARGVLTVAVWILLAAAASDPESAALWWTAFGLFVFTAATDAVDGALADPLVDKLLVLGTMILLLGVPGIARVLPAWAVALTVARELMVTSVRALVEARGVAFAAVPLGKAKMALQCVAVAGTLLHGAGVAWVRTEPALLAGLPGPPGTWNAAHVLVWIATLVTLGSGFAYARLARECLASRRAG
jgi:phosphatidylglycerophosphate synthase